MSMRSGICYAAILAVLGLLLFGCSGEPRTSQTAEEISLEVFALETLDSWEQTGRAHAKLTEMLAETMAEIQDEDAAKAAIPKFQALGPKFAAVLRAEHAMGKPSAEDRKTVLRIVHEANQKFDTAYENLKASPELFEMVEKALDKAYTGQE